MERFINAFRVKMKKINSKTMGGDKNDEKRI